MSLKNSIKYIVLSSIYSLFTIIGICYQNNNTLESINKPLILIISFIFFSGIYFLFMIHIRKFINNKNKINNKITNFIFDTHPFICPLFIILILWLPFIIGKFPADPGWDFYEIATRGLKTSHFPYAYSFICTTLYKNFNNLGLFFISLLHLIPMLIAFSLVFVYLKKWNTPYLYRYLILAFYSLNILFGSYSITLYSDVIFSSLLLIYILIIIDYIDNKKINIPLFIFIIISICLFKKNGFYIILIPTIFISIKFKNLFYKILPTIILLVCFSFNSYIKNHHKSSSMLELSIPIQQISRYSKKYHNDISEEDINNINKIVDYNIINKAYNPKNVDDAINAGRTNYNYSKKDRNDFLKTYFKLSIKHPNVYIQAFLNNTYNLYYPYQNSTPLIFNNYKPYIKNYINIVESIPLINYLDEPAFYIWIFIFLVIIVIKNKLNLLPIIPLIIVFITCLFGPAIYLHTRYALSIIFTIFPLCCYYKKKLNN